ncbi:MAG: GtrA family protein [Clostridiales bacterium]|nr:GtrA family protein [Clostridiales bacterium]
MEQKKNFKETFRAVKFTIISISAGIIQIGTFALMYDLFKWDYWVSYLTSLLLSVIWNFTINRKITFKSANNVKVAMLLVLAFYAVFTPVSTVLGHIAEGNGVDGFLVEIITMICNFVLEYVYNRFVVYRNSCDTAEKVKKEENKEENVA